MVLAHAGHVDAGLTEILLPLTGVVVMTALYCRAAFRSASLGPLSPRHWLAFGSGIALLSIAILPPLDPLTERSLAAHMAQHELFFVAPLLLVAGRAGTGMILGLDRRSRGWMAKRLRALERPLRRLTRRPAAWGLLILVLAVWHLPSLFDATLDNEWLHGLEHLSFFAASWVYWLSIVGIRRREEMGYGSALASMFGTILVGTAVGALLTFSVSPWYPGHAARVSLAGGDWLVDQQLAGLVMWIPPGIVLLAVFVYLAGSWLRAVDRSAELKEAAT